MINWTHRLLEAKEFARNGYDSIGLKRKYSGAPYWHHTESVAHIVSEISDDEDVIIGALVHDLLEEVNQGQYTLSNITKLFGDNVAQLTVFLTDVYTKENYPNLNRAERKMKEAFRLAGISADAQNIKLADIIDNTSDIIEHDLEFAKTYLKEKELILGLLTKANPMLMKTAIYKLSDAKNKIRKI